MMWFFVLVAGGGLIVVDRWVKALALRGVSHEFGFAQFILFKNDALVFSWPAPNSVAILLMMIAIAIVMYICWRMWRSRSWIALVGGALILSGALSNLYDRFVYGYVIDWAYLGPWWPVFNLADVMIGLGLFLILFRRKSV